MDNVFFLPIVSFFRTFWFSGTVFNCCSTVVQLLFNCYSTVIQLLYSQLPFDRRLRKKSTPTSCSVCCFFCWLHLRYVSVPMFPCSSMIGQGNLRLAVLWNSLFLSSTVWTNLLNKLILWWISTWIRCHPRDNFYWLAQVGFQKLLDGPEDLRRTRSMGRWIRILISGG